MWCGDGEETPIINKPFSHIAERRVFVLPGGRQVPPSDYRRTEPADWCRIQ